MLHKLEHVEDYADESARERDEGVAISDRRGRRALFDDPPLSLCDGGGCQEEQGGSRDTYM
jgi:hypothetical protein